MWWDNCSRVITPAGTSSPMLPYEVVPDEMLRAMLDIRVDEDTPFDVPAGDTCRRGRSYQLHAIGGARSSVRWPTNGATRR